MWNISLMILLVSLVIHPLKGAGTLESEKVISLLKMNRELWSYLGSTLDFSDKALGFRLERSWIHLGGERIGPYEILVKPKGQKNFYLSLWVICEQRFFDKDGKELPRKEGEITDEMIARAARVDEKVLWVKLISVKDEESVEENTD